jgi:hypothetical protein
MFHLQYPIGKFEKPTAFNPALLQNLISEIESFPLRLRKEVEHLSEVQLDTRYRPGGWTVRQVVHHCCDSHMNGITRHKLTLTEDRPTIKPYPEALFAEMADSKTLDISPALSLLDGIHQKWAVLLRSIDFENLNRIYIHPEHGREFELGESIALYAWHGNHHLAHITSLKKSKNWQ